MLSNRVYISHSWSYSELYNAMVKLLNCRLFFTWANYSIPETKAFVPIAIFRMKEELRQQIRPVNCVVVVGGMWTNHSDWIQFEMDFAETIGKPILEIRPHSTKNNAGHSCR